MKVKVKKKPAPSEAEQVFNTDEFRKWLLGYDRTLAEMILKGHRVSASCIHDAIRTYSSVSAQVKKIPAANENPTPFITQSLNGRRAENSKVCREDAVCAMESLCRSLKMIKNGPGIKDLRISEMIEFCKSLNR